MKSYMRRKGTSEEILIITVDSDTTKDDIRRIEENLPPVKLAYINRIYEELDKEERNE